MLSAARTNPAQRESEGEPKHPENVSSAHAASGNSTEPLSLFFPYRRKYNGSDEKMFVREFPVVVWQRIHSRDPSTCAHPGFAGHSRGAQDDMTGDISAKLKHSELS